jgi:polyvinyl alcohol dehydrogenase (cytochrome)
MRACFPIALRSFSVAALLTSANVADAGQAVQPPSGAKIYAERCATCHDAADATRAPSRESLGARSVEAIFAALSPGGVMSAQGAPLSATEKQAVAAFLGTPTPAAGNAGATPARDPGVCTTTSAPFSPSPGATWNGWGNDPSNSRFQSAAAAGLTPASVPKLTLKWAFAFPGATSATAQPAVVGGRVFVGSEAGGVWSLDLASGCTYWKFDTEAGVRSAVTIERVSQNPAR